MIAHMFVSRQHWQQPPATAIVTGASWLHAYARLVKDDPLWLSARYIGSKRLASVQVRLSRGMQITFRPRAGCGKIPLPAPVPLLDRFMVLAYQYPTVQLGRRPPF